MNDNILPSLGSSPQIEGNSVIFNKCFYDAINKLLYMQNGNLGLEILSVDSTQVVYQNATITSNLTQFSY